MYICTVYYYHLLFSWNRSGHNILSASTDNTVAIWDVLTGDCSRRYRFPSPILKVQYHPRKNDIFLVCPMRHAAVLVELEGTHKLLPLDEDEVSITIHFIIYVNNTSNHYFILSLT